MGVTLERVQNKFACIIGELCSEPDVLSQFAIWLDLRLAEYKAKGTISLECTGDDPDPSWLKGHKTVAERRKQRGKTLGDCTHDRQTRKSFAQASPGQKLLFDTRHIPDNVQDRLSPDVVVVKNEPSELGGDGDIFPVALHTHSDTNPSQMSPTKRTAAESIISVEQTFSQFDNELLHQQSSSMVAPSPKVRRVTSPCGSRTPCIILEPISESLMSIISGDIQGEDNLHDISDNSMESYKRGENSSFQFSRQPAAMTAHSGGAMIGSEEGSSSNDPAEAFTTCITGAIPPPSITDDTRVWEARETMLSVVYTPLSAELLEELSCLYPTQYPERLNSVSIKARFPNRNNKSANSLRDMVKCVGILERWLWCRHGEVRDLENIPAHELDQYLGTFYPILRKQGGEPYDPRTLANFRSHLVCFLHDCGYKYSISKSNEFSRSQVVFTRLTKSLSQLTKTK